MSSLSRENEHLFIPGKPALGLGNQVFAQVNRTGEELILRPQAQGTDSASSVGKDAAKIASEGVKSLRWVDPVRNPLLRGYQFGHWKPLSNRFGKDVRTKSGKPRPHQGLDILAAPGTPVYAVRDGIVAKIADTKGEGFGKQIMLEFKTSAGVTRYAFYGHLSKFMVKKGDKVKAGAILGLTGFTGNAEDVPAAERHLHFGIAKTITPRKGVDDWENPEHYMSIEVQEKLADPKPPAPKPSTPKPLEKDDSHPK